MLNRTKALSIAAFLVFSPSAFSSEMIRYEHDVYNGGTSQRDYGPQPRKDEQYITYHKKRYEEIREKKDKVGHPIYTAFPDRD